MGVGEHREQGLELKWQECREWGCGGVTGEVPCLFLPFPLHTPLYLLFTGHLHPAQCQAQGYYREKAQAHPQGMSRCQQLGRALEWTLNWEWPTDGHR